MTFRYRPDVSQDLRLLFRQDREALMSRDLGYSAITRGEGSLDLYEADDGPVRAAWGDQPDGRFGVGITHRGAFQFLPDILEAIEDKNTQQDGRLDGHDGTLAQHDTRITNAQARADAARGRADDAYGLANDGLAAAGRAQDAADAAQGAADAAQDAADAARAAAAAAQTTADDAGELAAAAKAVAEAAKTLAENAATQEELRAWKVQTINYIVRLNHAVRDLANELGGTDPGLPDPTPP